MSPSQSKRVLRAKTKASDSEHTRIMLRCLAIADDLSGAAEIAGIGYRFGLPGRILRDAGEPAPEGLTVFDTDSRSLPDELAVGRIPPLLRSLRTHVFDLIYKKTESVLRGNVAAETRFLRDAFQRRRVVFVPQNPSRGRTISRAGTYQIGGIPLDRTDFAHDPEHPARSADAWTLLREPGARCLGPADDALPEKGVIIGAAESGEDVDRWASRIDRANDLPAGSGDFFTALLAARGLRPDRPPAAPDPGRRLFLCGSASDAARALPGLAASHGVALCPMPDDLFAGSTPIDGWATSVMAALQRASAVLAFIPQPLDRAATERLPQVIAELAEAVLTRISVENLFLEGGATAAVVCQWMGWDSFDVTGELAPGVVRLRSGGQTLIIKPGSYPWPQSVW